MHVVARGIERVNVLDKESADKLMVLLIKNNCGEALSKKDIVGSKVTGQTFNIECRDTDISVVGQDNTEIVTHWLLGLGLEEVTIKRSEVCE